MTEHKLKKLGKNMKIMITKGTHEVRNSIISQLLRHIISISLIYNDNVDKYVGINIIRIRCTKEGAHRIYNVDARGAVIASNYR